MKQNTAYQGFEQGPIRPPSEARSLLIRVTRNCPWNRCAFCPVYKGSRFSLRSVEHVVRDIDAVHRYVEKLRREGGDLPMAKVRHLAPDPSEAGGDMAAFQAAVHWSLGSMDSVFLQDANSLIMPPKDLIRVLDHLKKRFPWVRRVTSYARSHTVARISDDYLSEMASAGLNRIHIGLESGSDRVLKKIKKGVDKATQIKAGQKIKTAGMELSEYVMPGLGGRSLSEEHAAETADALNQIDPDFIRLRTLAVPNGSPLAEQIAAGEFEKMTDVETAAEIRRFIQALEGITSRIVSDHILNLFEEVEGRLPEDKPRMLDALDRFLALDAEEQMLYQVGRRLGLFSRIDDLSLDNRRRRAEQACRQFGITPSNVDGAIDDLMKQFI
ncbi:MAG: radical SAM protein [Desulfobacterales bacterium]|nr:radical SAM protein [Desulfobacterales bacterium]